MVLTNYIQNRKVYDDERSAITQLTNEKIFYEIDGVFDLLVERSLLLSTDYTVQSLLRTEAELALNPSEHEAIEAELCERLDWFRALFDCDTVFLVSEMNKHYYTDKRMMFAYEEGDGYSEWYFELMAQDEEYLFNVDDDLARGGTITLFVNCKIRDSKGEILGAAGFGIQLGSVQEILTRNGLYQSMSAYLIGTDGLIDMSSQGLEDSDFFSHYNFAPLREQIQAEQDGGFYIANSGGQRNYISTCDIPDTPWMLVTVMRTNTLDGELISLLAVAAAISTALILVVVLTIRRAMHDYESALARYEAQRKEQSTIFRNATANLYDNIFHVNVTRDTGADEETYEFFAMRTVDGIASFSETMKRAARRHIKPEYQEKYIWMFSPENLTACFEEGRRNLELRLEYRDNDDSEYYWMLIVGYLYRQSGDDDIYLYSYRQNIDVQVRRELYMQGKAERDGLTGLYNKTTAQKCIEGELAEHPEEEVAFIMLDIDDFKAVNDDYGHAFGDEALRAVSAVLQENFRQQDIIGRVGGDEFCVFTKSLSGAKLEERIARLSQQLTFRLNYGGMSGEVSGSIGVVVGKAREHSFQEFYHAADMALYETKRTGKRGYKIFTEFEPLIK